MADLPLVPRRQVLRSRRQRRTIHLRDALFRSAREEVDQDWRHSRFQLVPDRQRGGLLGRRRQGRPCQRHPPRNTQPERDPQEEPVQRGRLQDPLAEVRRLPLRQGRQVLEGAQGEERDQVLRHVLQLRDLPHEGETNPGGQRREQGAHPGVRVGAGGVEVRCHSRRIAQHQRQFLRGESGTGAHPVEEVREEGLQPPVLVARRSVHRVSRAGVQRRRLVRVRGHARVPGDEHYGSFPDVGRGVGPHGEVRHHGGILLEDQSGHW